MRHSPWQTHRLMLQPWQRTLAIVFFGQFVMVLGFGIIFPFLPLYISDIGTTTGLSIEFSSGLVFAAQAFTMMLSSPVFGVLADRYSRKLITAVGMFMVAGTMWMMALARSAEELIFWRAVQGLVAGGISAATALVAATAPKKQVGFAMGMIQVALWAGVAAGPLVGGVLADARGYRYPIQIAAALMFAAGILIIVGVNEPKESAESQQKSFNFWAQWSHLFQVPKMGIIFSLRFMVGLGNMIIAPIAPLFILHLLSDSANVNTWTGAVSGVSGAASTLTSVYLGRLGDRIGHNTILKFCAVAAGVFYLPQAYVTEAWQLLVLQALTGASLGGMITSIAALLAVYSPAGEEGGVYGLDSAVFAAARVVAPLLGAALGQLISLRSVFSFTGVLFLLTALMVFRMLGSSSRATETPAAN